MKIGSLIRYDINTFLENDEYTLYDIGELEHEITLCNWWINDLVDWRYIDDVLSSNLSKYRKSGGKIIRKRSFSYKNTFPNICAQIRAEVNALHVRGEHKVIAEMEALSILKNKTDDGESLLNWHHPAFTQQFTNALSNKDSIYKPAHGILISKQYFGHTAQIRGRNGYSYGEARAIYKRYSKRFNDPESISFL